MKKILIIFGTRPEAIKLIPLIIEFKKFPDDFNLIVCSTGQHKEMLTQVYDDFDFKPHIELATMRENQGLFDLTGRLFESIGKTIREQQPDWVIAQGDTSTAMVASMCSHYEKIPFAHVEAGLRSNNKWAPFPEESNRRIISLLADKHFAPTQWASQNLLLEGVSESIISVTGNTGIDALLLMKERIAKQASLLDDVITESLELGFKIVLVTSHRRENFGEAIENLCHAIENITKMNKEILIVFPVHLNPNVRIPVFEILGQNSRIHLLEPLSYIAFIELMAKSFLIITDSGGIQEEALALNIPVLVTRKVTERPEGIMTGGSILVGNSTQELVDKVAVLLLDTDEYKKMATAPNPYGDGTASKRIVQELRFEK